MQESFQETVQNTKNEATLDLTEQAESPQRTFSLTDKDLVEISDILKKARNGPFWRTISAPTPEGSAYSSVAFGSLLAMLQKTDDRLYPERTLAVWMAGRAPLDVRQTRITTQTLRHILDRVRERDGSVGRERMCSALFRSMAIMFVLGGAGAAIGFLIGINDAIDRSSPLEGAFFFILSLLFYAIMFGVFGGLFAFPCVLPFSMAFDNMRSNRVRVMAAETLGRLGAPESACELAKAMMDRDRRVGWAAAAALHRVLPKLTSEHYGKLPAETVPNLCRLLEQPEIHLLAFPTDTELLAYRILAALEQIGDGRAVQAVERVANRGRTSRIQQRAEQILPILQERRQQENHAKSLLRAASGPVTAKEQLLRPSVEAQTREQANVLLRPTTSESTDPAGRRTEQ